MGALSWCRVSVEGTNEGTLPHIRRRRCAIFFCRPKLLSTLGFLTRLSSQTQQARTHNPRIIVNQSLPRHVQAITTDDPSGRWWQREARAPALRG